MTKRRREGTLITTVDVIRSGRIEHLDDEAYGVIRGEDDFLSKAERLAKELLNGPPSLRQDWAAHLQLYVHLLRAKSRKDLAELCGTEDGSSLRRRLTSVQFLDNPTGNSSTGTATSLVSLFQSDSALLQVERFVSWQVVRSETIAWLSGVDYAST